MAVAAVPVGLWDALFAFQAQRQIHQAMRCWMHFRNRATLTLLAGEPFLIGLRTGLVRVADGA